MIFLWKYSHRRFEFQNRQTKADSLIMLVICRVLSHFDINRNTNSVGQPVFKKLNAVRCFSCSLLLVSLNIDSLQKPNRQKILAARPVSNQSTQKIKSLTSSFHVSHHSSTHDRTSSSNWCAWSSFNFLCLRSRFLWANVILSVEMIRDCGFCEGLWCEISVLNVLNQLNRSQQCRWIVSFETEICHHPSWLYFLASLYFGAELWTWYWEYLNVCSQSRDYLFIFACIGSGVLILWSGLLFQNLKF